PVLLFFSSFFLSYRSPLHLPSFPTRRSSDLYHAHSAITLNLFLKDIRYRICTTHQSNHPKKPVNFNPAIKHTAFALPIVAIVPLSIYLNGSRRSGSFPSFIVCATYLPCCIATGAIPGKYFPFLSFTNAASPITNMFGAPGKLKSELTITLPALSNSAFNDLRRSGIVFPAAQTIFFVGINLSLSFTPSSFISVTK